MSVKGKDGKTVNIPESLIGQLRFKQTEFKDKWDTVIHDVPKNDEVELTKGLRTSKNREKDFEETLRRDLVAESIKSAHLKVDKDKIKKIMDSLVKEISDQESKSLKKENNYASILKDMATRDPEVVSVISEQKKLMEVLKLDGNLLAD